MSRLSAGHRFEGARGVSELVAGLAAQDGTIVRTLRASLETTAAPAPAPKAVVPDPRGTDAPDS